MIEEYDPLFPNNYDEIKGRKTFVQNSALPAVPGRTSVDGKFGEKMLKRMGWSEGTGLGKDQQGITEPLAVKRIPGSRIALVEADDPR